ncbi:MAG: succinate dehydrogenase, cytochrome b556 subunit [Gammaproteobacteria bacterium]|nr:succinate dehydrogenase, cytochrome b556 subunit [Gammaproteobacteria bacterium]
MDLNRKRPVYLNLLKIRLPVGGVVSIIHRISGVLLVMVLPVSVYLLQRMLQSRAAFERVATATHGILVKIVVLAVLWLFGQHFFAGIRHLLMDMDIGTSRQAGRAGAWLVFAASAAVVAYAAARLL